MKRAGSALVVVLGAAVIFMTVASVDTRGVTSGEAQSLGSVEPPQVDVVRLERIEDLCCPTRFAPDGKTYLTIQGGSLWVHSLSDTRAEQVLENVLSADWAPDGRLIVFAQRLNGPVASVGVLDLTSGQSKTIGTTRIPWRLLFDASNRVVLAGTDRFQLVDPVSGQIAELPLIESRGADPLNFTELAFSPDGRYVAAIEGLRLSVVDLENGTRVLVTEQIDRRRWRPFAWSSDASQLAYSMVPAQMAPPELWVINADGSAARRILIQTEGMAGVFAGIAWLPGTRFIAYQFIPHSNVATLHSQYQVVSADGGAPKTLFSNGLGLNLSPDGTVVSFVRDLPGAEEPGNWIAILSY